MARKKQNYDALIAACDTGDSMIQNRLRHMKLQGFSAGGKTHFALSFFAHLAEGKNPDECLMTIIDCDLEGQADLVAREDVLPAELRPRLLRKVCRNPKDVNDMVMALVSARLMARSS